MIQEYKSSGKPVAEWCDENNLKVKTYYYRARKVREGLCEKDQHEIVPISFPATTCTEQIQASIIIKKSELSIELSDRINAETLTVILKALQC